MEGDSNVYNPVISSLNDGGLLQLKILVAIFFTENIAVIRDDYETSLPFLTPMTYKNLITEDLTLNYA